MGTMIQQVLPAVFKDFLPVEITAQISWKAIGQGVALGLVISVLFALLPLVSVRNISPLFTLRISYEPTHLFRDPLKWLVYLLIIGFIVTFTWWQVEYKQAMFFTGSIVAAFLLLAGMARLQMWLVRRFFPSSWNYLWRQGFANLFRPNNQTLILVTTIGLGAAFIGTLYFIQDVLVKRVSLTASGAQPNMVLFDIQNSQKDQVADLTKQFNLPVLQQVPIVTMRIDDLNGITAARARQDTSLQVSSRIFEWEFRVTYRDSLMDSEKLKFGKLSGPVESPDDTIYISLDERYARQTQMKIGDKVTFNVQGTLIKTVVGSLREVDWNRVQTNFRVVFPTGVLEKAPQFHVLITRVPSPEVSAKFQQAVVRAHPNISIIDLGLILRVLDDILNKIGFVIRFMAGFSIVTGLIVLIASVLISKYQRIQESVLLRTLGASRRQIFIITALEYFFLGALASATGILISLGRKLGIGEVQFQNKLYSATNSGIIPVCWGFFINCINWFNEQPIGVE